MNQALAPVFANMFLSHHEESWLSSSSTQFKPKLYLRYVNDVFVIFDHRSHLPKLLRSIKTVVRLAIASEEI